MPTPKKNSKPRGRRNGLILLLGVGVLVICWAKWSRSQPTIISPAAAEQPPPARGALPETPGQGARAEQVDPAVRQKVSALLDDSIPLKTRRQAARTLAELGSDEAVAGMRLLLAEGSPYLKAAIGEGLGLSQHPEAPGLLASLADGPDEIAARGAIRGLAQRGDAGATDLLGTVLFDARKSDSLRTEAALALGEVPGPAALGLLVRAVQEIQDASVTDYALEGLSRRPFSETAEFFAGYLESPAWPVESKAAALEALGHSEGEVAEFLFKFSSDPEAELRAAAAWALSTLDTPAALGPRLLAVLQEEISPEVRIRLYQALGNQHNCDWSALLPAVGGETLLGPRLAGSSLLAQHFDALAPDGREFFIHTLIPEIQSIALKSANAEDRFAAVLTLSGAGAEQGAALQEIVRLSADARVVKAAQASLRVAQ